MIRNNKELLGNIQHISIIRNKRANPFTDDNNYREKKIVKKDLDAIHRKTLGLLMNNNARRKVTALRRTTTPTIVVGEYAPPTSGTTMKFKKCFSCDRYENVGTCSYCSNAICTDCSRTCYNEDGHEDGEVTVFCSTCTVINYDLNEERIFCLDCEEKIKEMKNNNEDTEDDM